MPNRLIHETSPYLLQHANNPVDWSAWGQEALQRAKEEDKPILLSVGYSACHWCHVMEHESFENEEIAALMNRYFVPIKVDREERPDIDHIYMNSVQIMTGQGGWPMTVFLTPDGKPFYGGTYYPPEDRYGRPGFPKILQAVAVAWQEKRDEIISQGEAMAEQLNAMAQVSGTSSELTISLLANAVKKLSNDFDDRLGGFGGAPKFPQPMTIDFLLRYGVRTGSESATQMAVFTLERMAMGGMYDQLGGGFHRYSTDEYWLVPHFEKMLYDNAQLVISYLHAYQITGDDFHKKVAVETLEYVLREMTAPDGGFYSAQDADSEGVEGKFFVWKDGEIRDILGAEDFALFSRLYDVTPRGNWEHANILNLSAPVDSFAKSMGQDAAAFESRVDEMRKKLLAHREERIKPMRDEKILTSWNGMMLAAFAEAAVVLGDDRYYLAAIRNAEFILSELYRDDILLRTGKHNAEGKFIASTITGFLEDYSNFADGLLRLYAATFDIRWLETAVKIVDKMLLQFMGAEGNLFDTPHDGEDLICRPSDNMDNATPAGNSVAVDVLLRLAILTGNNDYRQTADTILTRMVGIIGQHPGAFGRLLSAADFSIGPVKELAIIGDMKDTSTQSLLNVVRSQYRPNLIVQVADTAQGSFDSYPLLANRERISNAATAYVCENYVCKLPVTSPEMLAQEIGGRVRKSLPN